MRKLDGETAEPAGLTYVPEFVSVDEERALLAMVAHILTLDSSVREQAKKTANQFGFDYGYETWRIKPGTGLPAELVDVRMRCAKLIDLPVEKLAQTIITRYPPGAAIRWHREPPAYGPAVGVSLLSACLLRFQRIMPNKTRQVYQVALAPRSAYVLAEAARTLWQHGIPPVADLRYSITFRMEKARMRWLPE